MTEVAIRRCVLRIHRTSGWAWGAAPDALLAAATRALPELIASRLPAITDALAAPVHVTEPIRIRIATTARELAALADPAPAAAPGLRARVADEVAVTIARAAARARSLPSSALPPARSEAARAIRETSLAPIEADRDAPAHALRVWWRSGLIAQGLPQIDPSAARALHDMVLGAIAAEGELPPALLALAQEARAALASSVQSIADPVRQRIAIAAALLDAMPAVSRAHLRAAVDRVLPAASPAPGATTVSTTAPRVIEGARAPASFAPRACSAGEIEIRTVLPFLLLPALHHAGWLDSAGALLAAHELEDASFALAAGLAAKVLDPLERGWSRSGADRAVIGAFAGTDEPIGDAQISAAAARLRPIFGALDAVLRARLALARRPRPLVLWRDERGWLLVDADGMVALANHAQLRAVLAAAGAASIIVPAAFADPETLEQIDFANLRFVSDAPPSRGESWRSFAGMARRLITNDTATPIPRLVALTAELDPTLALAEELAGVLAERPAIPRDPVTAFDATCALAATAALADLGARLFPEETTTPVLALARFHDLDARVRFEAERIVVRVPLGRRHADLMRHGILGARARIPWLSGRTIDLGGA